MGHDDKWETYDVQEVNNMELARPDRLLEIQAGKVIYLKLNLKNDR